jgi:hypothetical protein
MEASFQTSSYLVSRFMGEARAPLPSIATSTAKIAISTIIDGHVDSCQQQLQDGAPFEQKQRERQQSQQGLVQQRVQPQQSLPEVSRPPWIDVFAVLKHKSLFVYSSDEALECMDILLVPDYSVDLFPEVRRDRELFRRDTPIRMRLKSQLPLKHQQCSPAKTLPHSSTVAASSVLSNSTLFVYCMNGSEKENWLVMLKRASKLQAIGADPGALSAQYQESDGHRQFVEAMTKLSHAIKVGGIPGAVDGFAKSNVGVSDANKPRVGNIGAVSGNWKGREKGNMDKIPLATTKTRINHSEASSPFENTDAAVNFSACPSSSTAWLNALVGRAFIGLHANPKIKEWFIGKINSRLLQF